jgi:hypothetical protein
MTIDLINDILSDLWSYDLVLIGILLSLFVLFYSFIIAKRDELRELSSEIKSSGTTNNPTLKLREHHAKVYIRNMQRINKRCAWLLFSATLHFALCWIAHRVIPNSYFQLKSVLLYVAVGMSLAITLFLIVQVVLIYRQYKTYTRI